MAFLISGRLSHNSFNEVPPHEFYSNQINIYIARRSRKKNSRLLTKRTPSNSME